MPYKWRGKSEETAQRQFANLTGRNAGQGLFRNDAVRWRLSKSLNVVFHIFAPALTVTDIVTFEIFGHEKVGQLY